VTYQDNHFSLAYAKSITCWPGQKLPIQFLGNSVAVNAVEKDPSAMLLRNASEFAGNRFFFGKGGFARKHGGQLAVSYNGTARVERNRYMTDLRSDGGYFFVDYQLTGKVEGEVLDGEFFRKTP
jgi:hypothetical protein